ncbi:alpha-tocopherol transfer protein-like [Phlebotomus argentipes]|uniref:alpha-tocopherol transfer protein-like n=1 Tax=Phlebotomus argentipes TaxID=94469 RepID=UPI0028932C71|nr:alpha-tocopherol transfer protein-like [Phlebotomus argentipes]
MEQKKYPMLLSDLDELPRISFAGYDLYFDPNLCPIATKVANEVLQETEEKKQRCIGELRKLLEQEKNLVVPIDNEGWLIRYLRARDYDVTETFHLIRRYYKFKIKYSDMYKDFIPSKMTHLYEHMLFTGTPEKDDMGRRVLFIEIGKKWKHKIVSIKELFRVCILIMEAASLEPTTQVLGGQVVVDAKGFNLSRANKFTPNILRMGIKWIQDCIPIKIVAFHVINENKFADIVWNLAKPLLRQEFRERIHFHGTDYAALQKWIPPRCLFTHYGGTVEIPELPTHDELWEQYSQWADKADKEFEVVNSYGFKN